MKKIAAIDLGFENCEVIKFGSESIGSFSIRNIKREINRNALNSIGDYKKCDEVFIQISSNANNSKSYITDFQTDCEETPVLPFTRMTNYMDITSIGIHYEDGTEEDIYVTWEGESDYTNEAQSCLVNGATGDLYLAISKKENASSYFKEYFTGEYQTYWNNIS